MQNDALEIIMRKHVWIGRKFEMCMTSVRGLTQTEMINKADYSENFYTVCLVWNLDKLFTNNKYLPDSQVEAQDIVL